MTHTAGPAARNAFLLQILVLVATGTGIPRQAVRAARRSLSPRPWVPSGAVDVFNTAGW
jgi:hypothetical protein